MITDPKGIEKLQLFGLSPCIGPVLLYTSSVSLIVNIPGIKKRGRAVDTPHISYMAPQMGSRQCGGRKSLFKKI